MKLIKKIILLFAGVLAIYIGTSLILEAVESIHKLGIDLVVVLFFGGAIVIGIGFLLFVSVFSNTHMLPSDRKKKENMLG
ncbi:hypothetical protein KJA13_02375 [Patescibacteria group bacterium]|nr:hypothetical protein [Patescibacteria group bacterium]